MIFLLGAIWEANLNQKLSLCHLNVGAFGALVGVCVGEDPPLLHLEKVNPQARERMSHNRIKTITTIAMISFTFFQHIAYFNFLPIFLNLYAFRKNKLFERFSFQIKWKILPLSQVALFCQQGVQSSLLSEGLSLYFPPSLLSSFLPDPSHR